MSAQEKPVFAKKVVVDKNDAKKLKVLQNLGVCRIENGNTFLPTEGMSMILKDSKIFVFSSSYGVKKDAVGKYEEIYKLMQENKDNPFGNGKLEGKMTMDKVVVANCYSKKCSPCGWEQVEGRNNVYKCGGCSPCTAAIQTESNDIKSYTDNQNRVRRL